MPRVPSFVPQVGLQSPQSGGYQVSRIVPFEFQTLDQMKETADATMRWSASMARRAADTKDRESNARVKMSDAVMTEYSANDMKELSDRNGVAAIDWIAENREKYNAKHAGIRKGLKSERERQAFDEVTRSTNVMHHAHLDRVHDEQTRGWLHGASVSRGLSAVKQAAEASLAGEYGIVDQALETFRTEAVSRMPDMPASQQAAYVQNQMSGAHSAVLAALENDPQAASAYLEAHASQIPPQEAQKARDVVSKAFVQDRAQKITDYLDQDPSVPFLRKAAHVQKMYADGDIDVGLRQAVMDNLNKSNDMRYRESQREEADALQAAQQASASRSAALGEAKTAAGLAVVDFSGLAPNIQQKLEATGAKAEFDLWAVGGGMFHNTTRGLSALYFMEDSELSKYKSLEQLRSKFQKELSPEKWGEMTKRWDAIQTGRAAPDAWVNETVKLAAINANMLPSAVDGKRDSPELTEKDKNTLLRVNHAIRALAEKDGKRPTKADIEMSISDVFGQVMIENETGKKRVVAGLTPEELDTIEWRGAGGGFVMLPAATDVRRGEAYDRIIRKNKNIADWNAANPTEQLQILNPDDPQTVIDTMLSIQSEVGQSVVKAKLEEARKFQDGQAARRADEQMRSEALQRADAQTMTDFWKWFTNGEDVVNPNLLNDIFGVPTAEVVLQRDVDKRDRIKKAGKWNPANNHLHAELDSRIKKAGK